MFKKLLKFFNPLSLQKEVFEINSEEEEKCRAINRAVAMTIERFVSMFEKYGDDEDFPEWEKIRPLLIYYDLIPGKQNDTKPL